MRGFFDFINEHFNVLLLAVLFLTVLGVLFHAMHHTVDTPVLNWLEHISDQIIAALLGMMTGYRLAMSAGAGGQGGAGGVGSGGAGGAGGDAPKQ